MTKVHQQVMRGTAAQIIDQLEVVKGEFVLVIGPIQDPRKEIDLHARYQALLDQGFSPSQSVKIIARETSSSKREIYQKVVTGPEREPETKIEERRVIKERDDWEE